MMYKVLFALLHLVPCGLSVCTKRLEPSQDSEDITNPVFVDGENANKFIKRHLLLNRFDFEIFTPGNLERECKEEVCNYEEAREVFENIPETDKFWAEYTAQEQHPRFDVTALLVGLIAGGVTLVIVGLLIWYACQRRLKGSGGGGPARARGHARSRRSNASLIIRRLEEISLQPVGPPSAEEADAPGLPSYEQAIAGSGAHDAPPPPYPGSRPGTIRR
ncbi:hypothetical protein ACEWY4_015703 [Coilia grayii]|uniref:Gla domain-containing protein n=1 Tax=Coilia grayii TaxID=363190 RepID=A0ABD1JNU2_9TELE